MTAPEPADPTASAPPTADGPAPGGPRPPGPRQADPVRHRLRFRYGKVGKVRFTSHRDVARMWERALRRSGLPVAWSGGFSPHPLLSFGLALPTGAESSAEYVDIALDGPPGGETVAELVRRLSVLLPEGVDVLAAGVVAEGSGSLQQEVSSCSWDVEVQGLAAEELATRVEQLLAAPTVVVRRERKGRPVQDDVRPAVLALDVAAPGCLHAELATRPRGVRPQELLCGLGPDVTLVRAHRRHQWIERDGARWEPLTMSSEVAQVGAS